MEYLSKIKSISEEKSGISARTGEEWHCVDIVIDLVHENGRVYGESIKASCTDRTKYNALKVGDVGVARIWSNVNDRGYQNHKLNGWEPRAITADHEFDGGSKHSGVPVDGENGNDAVPQGTEQKEQSVKVVDVSGDDLPF